MKKKIIILSAGGFAGYLYYYFIGCTSGSCPITSNPYSSVLYGMAFSAIFLFTGKQKK